MAEGLEEQDTTFLMSYKEKAKQLESTIAYAEKYIDTEGDIPTNIWNSHEDVDTSDDNYTLESTDWAQQSEAMPARGSSQKKKAPESKGAKTKPRSRHSEPRETPGFTDLTIENVISKDVSQKVAKDLKGGKPPLEKVPIDTLMPKLVPAMTQIKGTTDCVQVYEAWRRVYPDTRLGYFFDQHLETIAPSLLVDCANDLNQNGHLPDMENLDEEWRYRFVGALCQAAYHSNPSYEGLFEKLSIIGSNYATTDDLLPAQVL